MIKHGDIAAIALARPDMPALVSVERTVTWQQFADEVATLVKGLQQQFDLRQVSQMAFVSENRVELVLLLAAFSTLGITTTGIDYLLDSGHARRAIETVSADFLVLSSRQTGAAWAEQLTQGWSAPVIDLDSGPAWRSLTDSLQLESSAGADVATAPARPFRAVAYTSGTSGDAKATLRTRSGDARRFHYFTTRYALHADDRYLLTIPLYHVAGNGWARHFLSIGASLHLIDIARPQSMMQAVREQRVTAMVTTPINLTRILDDLEAQASPVEHALRFVVVGGKNFSPSQKRRALRALGPVVYEYYGSTETGVNTIAEPPDLHAYPDSVGRPYAEQRIVAVDETGGVLPVGQAGRLAVSSFLLMDHYLGAPTNELIINGERYLLTPDHGYLDEDGRVYILNRSAGKVHNYNTYLVEERVRTLPGVRDVAILIDPAIGEAPDSADCAITLRQEGSVDMLALLDQVRDTLTAHRLRGRVVRVVDTIPYSLSGKIRWREVEHLLATEPVVH